MVIHVYTYIALLNRRIPVTNSHRRRTVGDLSIINSRCPIFFNFLRWMGGPWWTGVNDGHINTTHLPLIVYTYYQHIDLFVHPISHILSHTRISTLHSLSPISNSFLTSILSYPLRQPFTRSSSDFSGHGAASAGGGGQPGRDDVLVSHNPYGSFERNPYGSFDRHPARG